MDVFWRWRCWRDVVHRLIRYVDRDYGRLDPKQASKPYGWLYVTTTATMTLRPNTWINTGLSIIVQAPRISNRERVVLDFLAQ